MGITIRDAAAPDAGALLTLSQWLSPGFPVGAYAYSHGLEWAIDAGEVRDAAALTTWLEDVLAHGAGRSDAILLVHALRPGADLADLDDLAMALAASGERARELREQGAAFAAAVNALDAGARPARAYPVAVGAAASALELPAATVAALFLQAFAANLVAAAVRFVPLGQGEGQHALAALRPLIGQIAAEAAHAPLDAIGTAAFGADLAAMHHETMTTRIFKT